MHIPDGYLGPPTYLASYAVMTPFWVIASRKLGRSLKSRQVPLLAIGAAFCFVIMMFDVPALGTTGHAVGAVLLAVLLGPWAACVAMTTVIVVQALMLGDGGITAIGANCLTMALIMPFSGWGVYRLIDRRLQGREWLAAAISGYVGLNLTALATAVLVGIQPLIAVDAAGRPLYAPYSLDFTLPVMAVGHLAVFGWMEALVTGLVVAYLHRHAPELLPYRRVREGNR